MNLSLAFSKWQSEWVKSSAIIVIDHFPLKGLATMDIPITPLATCTILTT